MDDIETLIKKKALEAWYSSKSRHGDRGAADVVEELRRIARGSRVDEIIERALELYGDVARRAFSRLVDLYRAGSIRELSDYELYNYLRGMGLHVPLQTRVRVVRRGEKKAEDLGESLRAENWGEE